MPPVVPEHPSVEELTRFGSGQIDPGSLPRISVHVESCEACRQTLAGLKGDTLEGLVRSVGATADDATDMLTVGSPSGNSGQDSAVAIPERLGDYRIVRVLGQGGMGTVYEAVDERLKRRVALKVMRPEVAARPEARTRFIREAQTAAALEHDHVVAIYQVGEEGGVPFLAMPLLKGESLEDRLKVGGNFTLDEILRIGRQMAEGLAAAHERGLIHRDIKPANIWLESLPGRPAGEFRVKILDFGLARLANDDTHLTGTGTIVGTPAYMAPEQARGDTVDGRADLFSLGCVLYRLSTGRMAFRGDTTMAILMSLATEHPSAPRELRREIPPVLSDLTLRLLAKNPADRPASARAVIELLHQCDEPTPAPQPRPAPEEQKAPPKRSFPWAVATAVGALTLLILAGVVFFWQTPDGVVRVECDDPSIKIALDDGEMKIVGAYKEPLTLKPGKHGLKIKRDDFEFETDKLVVNRGDKVVLRIEVLPGKVQVVQDGKGVIGSKEMPPAVVVKQPEGTELFNGRDLTGWKHVNGNTAADWSVENGWLANIARPGAKSDGVLESVTKFQDFTFRCEFRLSEGAYGKLTLGGGFVDLNDVKHGYDGGESGTIRNLGGNTWLKAKPSVYKGPDQWNTLEVTRQGNQYRVTLNGVVVNDRKTDVVAGPKPIGITQFTKRTELRNLRIEPLTSPDLDRQAAEWVLSIGGTVQANEKQVKVSADLPPGPLRLTQVNLEKNARATDEGLAHFKDCAGLTYLNLAITPVTDAGLAHFKDCKRLTYLNLSHTKVTDAGLVHFKDCRGLEELWLAQMRVSDIGLANFKDCKSLTHLILDGTQVSDSGLEPRRELVNPIHVSLKRTNVTEAGVKKLATALPKCRIEWDGGIIDPAKVNPPSADPERKAAEWVLTRKQGIAVVLVNGEPINVPEGGQLPANPFKLTGCQILDPEVTDNDLSRLAGLTELAGLNLHTCSVTDAGLPKLVPLPKLAILNLERTKVTEAGFAVFQKFPALRELTLSEAVMTDEGLKHLAALPGLEYVGLKRTKVTEAGVKKLAAALPKCRIEWDGGVIEPAKVSPAVGDPDRQAVEFILANGGVFWTSAGHDDAPWRTVPAGDFRLTKVKFFARTHLKPSQFGPMAGCKNLTALHLEKTLVGDEGIAQFRNSPGLHHVFLSGTGITDAGLDVLRDRKPLAVLILNEMAITDAGLAKLAGCSNLIELDVRKTGVTADGVKQLAAALPKCKITWDRGVIEPQASNRFTNSLGMAFARVPKGKAWLGDGGGNAGQREVEMKQDFFFGVYEVTQDEWQKVMGSNPSRFSTTGDGADLVKDLADADRKRLPVEMVSWDDCQEFLKKLNEQAKDNGWTYRLPTEDEWEYACRGGPMTDAAESKFDYYLEAGAMELLPTQASFNHDKSPKRTVTVGTFRPNRLGLHDLHGNVAEWCDTEGTKDMPVKHRMIRGGSFDDSTAGCRVTSRDPGGLQPTVRHAGIGLRVVRVPVMP